MLTLTPTTQALSGQEAQLAEESSRALSRLDDDTSYTIRLALSKPGEEDRAIVLPNSALSLLSVALKQMGLGRGVAVVATDMEMTTQEAANFLNVSRPYFVKLLEQGKIPYHKVGVRRRVRLEDLLRYIEENKKAAAQALNEMAAEHQRLGLYP